MTTQAAKPEQNTAEEQAQPEPYGPIVLRLHPAVELTDEQFAELCELNEALRIERNAQGDLEILPPTVPTTGNQNFNINVDCGVWARGDGTGVPFDSSTGFTLSNGSVRSPDTSWILKTRIQELTDEQKEGFWQISPDFVIELRSSSDTLAGLQRKMHEYMENGVRLGWLIDPLDPARAVYIYRPNAEVAILEAPESVSGEPELPGFTLDLTPIWEPAF